MRSVRELSPISLYDYQEIETTSLLAVNWFDLLYFNVNSHMERMISEAASLNTFIFIGFDKYFK